MHTKGKETQERSMNMEKSMHHRQADIRKCGIWGCGRVGSTVAYALTQSGWFSDVVLMDPLFRIAETEAADLSHGLPFHTPVDVYAGDFADLADCGLIILAEEHDAPHGAAQLKSRLTTLRSVIGNVNLYNRDAILLCLTAPVESTSYLLQQLSNLPPSRVIGAGTVLDTARLKQMVGRHLGVDSRNVHSFIIGEQGENEFPVWSSANISGIDLKHYCDSCQKGYDPAMLKSLFYDVRDSRAQVIRTKGAGFYGVAEAVKRIVSAIVHDENTILTVSALMEGQYGIENVYMSLPCIVNRRGIRRVLEIPLNEEEEQLLRRSASKLKAKAEELEKLLFQPF